MMNAEENLRSGRLDEALIQLQDEVRTDPANPKLRIFLFQLLVLMGEWERAFKQLKVIGDLDASALAMVQTYRAAVECEVFRLEVFEAKRAPLIFGEPSSWVALLLEAHRLTAQKKYADAERLRNEAFDAASAISGTIDNQAFEWIADADSRLGPMLEAIINGRYYWIPFESLSILRFDTPSDLRDLVWMPGYLTLVNGGELVALIPTRYPGSESSTDSQIRMSRKTQWLQQGEQTHLGLGQRMLTTDQAEYPLMEIRSVTLDSATAAPARPEEEQLPTDG